MKPSLDRVLVLGSGGREHALAKALLRGHPSRVVIVAPGNGGTSEPPRLCREPVDLGDVAAVVALAERLRVDLVIVGPEGPLVLGVIDALSAAGIRAYGPSKRAAELEGSKAFFKAFAAENGLRTAPFDVVTSYDEAERVIAARGAPIVVKASGLASGKGVVVAETESEARQAARAMLSEGAFGAAGATVVLESCLVGREVSVHAICDGERFLMLPAARDHKRIFEADRGPNTGGMGVVCPAIDVSAELTARIRDELIAPTLAAMQKEGMPFRGTLFAGIMIDADETPWLLEYNVRFGDPETEALLELYDGDWGVLLGEAAAGSLDPLRHRWSEGRHVCVVILASEGYPVAPKLGDRISGLTLADTPSQKVFHAGTEAVGPSEWATSGGRVLAVVGVGESATIAREHAYDRARTIRFRGMQLRADIGLTLGAPSA